MKKTIIIMAILAILSACAPQSTTPTPLATITEPPIITNWQHLPSPSSPSPSITTIVPAEILPSPTSATISKKLTLRLFRNINNEYFLSIYNENGKIINNTNNLNPIIYGFKKTEQEYPDLAYWPFTPQTEFESIIIFFDNKDYEYKRWYLSKGGPMIHEIEITIKDGKLYYPSN